jgi:hypothetical protein
MKFVLAYTTRPGGSATENVSAGEAAQKLLANWTPSPAATIHQWLQRADGNGGFSVVETDNVGDLFKDLATWSPWLDFQVYPVLDIVDAIPLQEDALNTAKSVI